MEIVDNDQYQLLTKGLVKMDFERKRIELIGQINDRNAKKFLEFLKKFEFLGAISIDFLINSQGGNGFSANKIGAGIQKSSLRVRGINVGLVYSAAINILETCHLRASLTNGKFRMHKISYSDLKGRLISLKDIDKSSQKLAQFNLEWLSYKTGQSIEVIKKWSKVEKFWDAPNALKDGLIDEILYNYDY